MDRGWRIADLIVARLRLKLAGAARVGIRLSHGCNGVQSTRSKTGSQRSDALKCLEFSVVGKKCEATGSRRQEKQAGKMPQRSFGRS